MSDMDSKDAKNNGREPAQNTAKQNLTGKSGSSHSKLLDTEFALGNSFGGLQSLNSISTRRLQAARLQGSRYDLSDTDSFSPSSGISETQSVSPGMLQAAPGNIFSGSAVGVPGPISTEGTEDDAKKKSKREKKRKI